MNKIFTSVPLTTIDSHERNAEDQYEILLENIRDIETSLDADHEISLMLASFGQSVIMQVESIGFHGKLMIFNGAVNGEKATLFQHMNQLNLLALVRPKADPNKPVRRIGFKTNNYD